MKAATVDWMRSETEFAKGECDAAIEAVRTVHASVRHILAALTAESVLHPKVRLRYCRTCLSLVSNGHGVDRWHSTMIPQLDPDGPVVRLHAIKPDRYGGGSWCGILKRGSA
jgi:hypothetical protein